VALIIVYPDYRDEAMGGKLFNLGRIDRSQYLNIEAQVRDYLDRKVGAANYRVPRYYGNKPDFGDMDIIIRLGAETNWLQLRQEIVADLGIASTKAAGSVYSTVYQNLQVDYFTTAPGYFESTYNYLSFNDLGNLLGKICRRFNLKYGERGLSYVYRRDNGNYKKDIELTTDFQVICQFLGLDYVKWLNGFANLEEIFAWTIHSPYFSVNPYVDRSTSLEKRLKERSTIQEFLAYLQHHQIDKAYQYLENRDDYIPWIASNFPAAQLPEKIAQENADAARAIAIKAKFNGEHLMELLPNLSGKELGQFILRFKQQFADFEEFIISTEQLIVDQEINDFYHLGYGSTPPSDTSEG
jgi:hypothetical protein